MIWNRHHENLVSTPLLPIVVNTDGIKRISFLNHTQDRVYSKPISEDFNSACLKGYVKEFAVSEAYRSCSNWFRTQRIQTLVIRLNLLDLTNVSTIFKQLKIIPYRVLMILKVNLKPASLKPLIRYFHFRDIALLQVISYRWPFTDQDNFQMEYCTYICKNLRTNENADIHVDCIITLTCVQL